MMVMSSYMIYENRGPYGCLICKYISAIVRSLGMRQTVATQPITGLDNDICLLGPLLLTWFNFNLSMDQ